MLWLTWQKLGRMRCPKILGSRPHSKVIEEDVIRLGTSWKDEATNPLPLPSVRRTLDLAFFSGALDLCTSAVPGFPCFSSTLDFCFSVAPWISELLQCRGSPNFCGALDHRASVARWISVLLWHPGSLPAARQLIFPFRSPETYFPLNSIPILPSPKSFH